MYGYKHLLRMSFLTLQFGNIRENRCPFSAPTEGVVLQFNNCEVCKLSLNIKAISTI
jgi:hypothetical protein